MYQIQYQDKMYSNLSWDKLKKHEGICRGYRCNYVITMPDGFKITAKFEGK